jgi:hypothetical protein
MCWINPVNPKPLHRITFGIFEQLRAREWDFRLKYFQKQARMPYWSHLHPTFPAGEQQGLSLYPDLTICADRLIICAYPVFGFD